MGNQPPPRKIPSRICAGGDGDRDGDRAKRPSCKPGVCDHQGHSPEAITAAEGLCWGRLHLFSPLIQLFQPLLKMSTLSSPLLSEPNLLALITPLLTGALGAALTPLGTKPPCTSPSSARPFPNLNSCPRFLHPTPVQTAPQCLCSLFPQDRCAPG